MSEPFIGQIDFFAFNFVPQSYLPCIGQAVPIGQYQALASLLGTTYGGDGRNTFGLPDLRGLLPVGIGTASVPNPLVNWQRNTKGGVETVTLTQSQYPIHSHLVNIFTGAPISSTAGGGLGFVTPNQNTAVLSTQANMQNSVMLGVYAGGGGAHPNMQPYITFTACICCDGMYPDFP